MEKMFPKFIQEEIERPRTPAECAEDFRALAHVFEKARIDPDAAAIKVLTIQVAMLEKEVDTLKGIVGSLLHRRVG